MAACTQERLSRSERYVVPSQPGPGEVRTVTEGMAAVPREATSVRLGRSLDIGWSGRALPLVSPDGTRMVVEAASSIPVATRLGDPPPAEGIDAELDIVSLAEGDAGAPVGTVRGAWILGRSASGDGFPLERPRPDGSRDIAFCDWRGRIRTVASDGWCNAHAAAADGGLLAWSRRQPEGGDWRLVVRRGTEVRVLDAPAGTGMLAPLFSGDGRGIFAIEVRGSAATLAWLPFGEDGLPDRAAAGGPGALRTPLTANGNLSWALRATDPGAGGRGSRPGSGNLLLWNPDVGRMLAWLPGSAPEPLMEGSMAAVEAGGGNVLVTAGDAVYRERAGTAVTPSLALDGAWVLQPLTGAAGRFVAIRPANGRLRVATATFGATGDETR